MRRHNSFPGADYYDSVGDPYWFCPKHGQWWHDYCSGCCPSVDLVVKIGAGILASAIVVACFGPFVPIILGF